MGQAKNRRRRIRQLSRVISVPLIFGTLSLAACAPRLAFSNEAGGVLNLTGSAGNDRAYALATDHCAKYGKVARIGNRDLLTARMPFECVAKQ